MSNVKKVLAVGLLLITLSFWGCSQKQNTVGNARIRELDTENAKLKEDFRVAVGQRDLARKKLSTLEEEMAQQQEQVQAAFKERDELRRQASARTVERDGLHAQLVQLGKELQNLAGRVD